MKCCMGASGRGLPVFVSNTSTTDNLRLGGNGPPANKSKAETFYVLCWKPVRQFVQMQNHSGSTFVCRVGDTARWEGNRKHEHNSRETRAWVVCVRKRNLLLLLLRLHYNLVTTTKRPAKKIKEKIIKTGNTVPTTSEWKLVLAPTLPVLNILRAGSGEHCKNLG